MRDKCQDKSRLRMDVWVRHYADRMNRDALL